MCGMNAVEPDCDASFSYERFESVKAAALEFVGSFLSRSLPCSHRA